MMRINIIITSCVCGLISLSNLQAEVQHPYIKRTWKSKVYMNAFGISRFTGTNSGYKIDISDLRFWRINFGMITFFEKEKSGFTSEEGNSKGSSYLFPVGYYYPLKIYNPYTIGLDTRHYLLSALEGPSAGPISELSLRFDTYFTTIAIGARIQYRNKKEFHNFSGLFISASFGFQMPFFWETTQIKITGRNIQNIRETIHEPKAEVSSDFACLLIDVHLLKEYSPYNRDPNIGIQNKNLPELEKQAESRCLEILKLIDDVDSLPPTHEIGIRVMHGVKINETTYYDSNRKFSSKRSFMKPQSLFNIIISTENLNKYDLSSMSFDEISKLRLETGRNIRSLQISNRP